MVRSTRMHASLSLCANMVWLLSGGRVQAQPLPQPTVAAVHGQCEDTNPNSRALWFDEFGQIDEPTLPHHSSWFYTKNLSQTTGNDVLRLFVDRDEICPGFEFPVTNPWPPNLGCLDFDHNTQELWGGPYLASDQFAHFWKYVSGTGWINWFDVADLYPGAFIHDPDTYNFDGVAVTEDSSLYLGADLVPEQA